MSLIPTSMRTAVTVDGQDYFYVWNDTAPADPVEEKRGRFFVRMGFAGFNTRANNANGYATRAAALATIRKFQAVRP